MSDLPADAKVLRVQLRQARDDAAKAGAIHQAFADLYHSALTRIFNLAQEDECGDMIRPILDTCRLALDEGKTFEQAEKERREQRMAGIDLSGRPAQ